MKTIILILAILFLGTAIFIKMEGQLRYPLDQTSKEIIQKTVDEFLSDKIFNNVWSKYFIYTAMPESFEVWTAVGDGVYATQSLTSGALTDNKTTLSSNIGYQNFLSFQKRQRFRTYISVDSIDAMEAKIGVGRIFDGASVTAQFYGFKVVDGKIYGYTDVNAAETTTDLGITIAPNDGADINIYSLEARYVPNGKILFYAGETKYSTADSIVTSRQDLKERGKIELATGFFDNQYPENVVDFHYNIKTTEAVDKTLYFSIFEFAQEK